MPRKSLQGPIGIFSELKTRLEHLGFPSFLRLVALIGLNLFLINLLPIPVTDGGQLALLGIETAIRRPLPPLAVNIINSIGFVLIILLMLYAVGLMWLDRFLANLTQISLQLHVSRPHWLDLCVLA